MKYKPGQKVRIKKIVKEGEQNYCYTALEKLEENDFPLKIKEVRRSDDPLHAVSKGCLIAATVF